jgi:formate/nitrite transporter FocA (FNT family)
MTNPIDQLNPALVQIIRSAVQALWAAVLQLTAVAEFLDWAGVDSTVVEGLLFSLTLAVVVVAGRALAKVHPIFGWLLNGIHSPPAYPTVESATRRR